MANLDARRCSKQSCFRAGLHLAKAMQFWSSWICLACPGILVMKSRLPVSQSYSSNTILGTLEGGGFTSPANQVGCTDMPGTLVS